MVQVGRAPSDFKTVPSVGPGVCEIRMRDAAGAFRVLYAAKFPEAVYVLHAFKKTTQKTSREDMEMGTRRYRTLRAER